MVIFIDQGILTYLSMHEYLIPNRYSILCRSIVSSYRGDEIFEADEEIPFF